MELFDGLPAASRGPENDMLTTGLHNYTCNTTTCEGYMAYNASGCTASMKCPAVVVIQDWNGMNDYEKERSRMLAEMGYVGFAADIYGYARLLRTCPTGWRLPPPIAGIRICTCPKSVLPSTR